ncbi:conserved hypothetical protein [Leptothrix cholodnii SP-6]|uniref:bAvd-like domain-containing protein n=1 Tax=Leptothrix cholodnii (strain ATCC 51168 / LMG 8142 / SP-6) TaxID=395495 RepID=B1Y3J4_LEPCP|nr:four helix bundle protein [Leptothrix cholodnii]ACB34522.1 conserved hypothetical protein [Leptothrix cholodnii SP-6]
MSLHSEAQLNRKFTEFAKLMNVYLAHFPKAEKYGLAQAIRVAAYDVYALIVECQKRYHKKTTLTNLDVRHEQLRMLLSLANDLGYFGFHGGVKAAPDDGPASAVRRYVAISRLVDELGRMIGGWVKSERKDSQVAATGEAS